MATLVDTDRTEARSSSAFTALRNPDFRLFWIGACLSFIGSWVQIVAMGWLVYRITGSKEALGIIGLAGGIPTTVLMLFGGVIADRANKRALVMTTQTIFGLTAFALAALTWTGRIALWHIAVLSFINGVVFAADGPARQAMIVSIVGREDLAGGVALQSAAFNLARVIGPAIGGLLYAAVGPAWCFFINGVSFGAIIIAVALVRTNLSVRAEPQNSVWIGLMEGLRYLRSNRLMKSVVSLTAITSVFAFSAYSTLMPAIGKDTLHLSEDRYGWLFSAVGLGSLVGVYLVGQHAAAGRRGRLMFTGALVFAVALFGLTLTRNFAAALALLFVVGLAAISQLTTANTLTQSLAPDRLQGRAVSVHMFAMAGLQPIGAYLAGSVAQRWGVGATLRIDAAILALYALLLLATRPEVARLE
jgi:predicted MFS family arabinose efflux permease